MHKNKTLDINDFVSLLLGTLAKNSKIIDAENQNNVIVSVPVLYKQIIQNILCAENSWKEEFSLLIDTEEYFNDHFGWEENLVLAIKHFLNDSNKTFTYDLVFDSLLISFSQDEVSMILEKYPDEELKNIMDHFVNLLTDYIYTRDYQEKYFDYYAFSVKKMHDMTVSKTIDNLITNLEHSKNRTRTLLKK